MHNLRNLQNALQDLARVRIMVVIRLGLGFRSGYGPVSVRVGVSMCQV